MVIVIIFVVMLGFGLVAPILPLFARSFGVGYEAAGLLISAFAFTRLLADPVSGPLVDRFGERRTAAAGLAAVGMSSILTGLAPTFALAVVFRGAGGAGSAVLFTALTSYLLKVVPKERMGRTLGVFYGAFNAGVIAGGPLGGLIAHWTSLRGPLFVYAGLLFVAGLMYLRFVHDPEPRGAPEEDGVPREAGIGPLLRRTWRSTAELFRRPAFGTTIFLNFAYLWMVIAVYDTLVPLFGDDRLNMSTVGIGVVFAVALVAEMLTLYPAGLLADRRGRKFVLVPTMAGLAVMVAVLGYASTPIVFGILMFGLGLMSGAAGVTPGAMLADVAPDQRSGTAVGVFRFAGDLGFVLGPLVAGWATNAFGFQGAYWIASIPLVVATVLAARAPETLRREASV
jgi:MFS family permease